MIFRSRAGWCPGMAVPLRIDKFNEDMSNSTFEYDYGFQAWTNNLQTDASNKHAYYAISTFIVLKSNEEISAASVLD